MVFLTVDMKLHKLTIAKTIIFKSQADMYSAKTSRDNAC